MKRVLALVGAILLVVVAVVVRGMLDDGDGNGGSDGDADLVVACIPELRDACEALDADVRIEDPADTIDHADEVDAWVTFDPWPEMAGFQLTPNPFDDVRGVATSELVLLARNAARDQCGEPVTWTCVVDTVGDDAALPPTRSALRAVVLGQAAADFFGGPGLATNDLDADPELARRISRLGRPNADPFDDVRIGLPQPSALGALAVDLPSLGSRRSTFAESPSGAEASVAVVVAAPGDHNAAGRIAGNAEFVEALVEAGWTPDGGASTTGLPRAGVLIALQEVSS